MGTPYDQEPARGWRDNDAWTGQEGPAHQEAAGEHTRTQPYEGAGQYPDAAQFPGAAQYPGAAPHPGTGHYQDAAQYQNATQYWDWAQYQGPGTSQDTPHHSAGPYAGAGPSAGQPQQPAWQAQPPGVAPQPPFQGSGQHPPWNGGPSSPWGPLPPPPAGLYSAPPKRRRTGLIIGVSAVGVAALVGVVALAGSLAGGHPASGRTSAATRPSASGQPHTIALPASVAGYRHLTGNVAHRVVAASRASMDKASPAWSAAYARAKIALYSEDIGPTGRLIFIGLSAADSPRIADLMRSQSPSGMVDQFFLGAGISNTTDFPAGQFGGVLRCGQLTQNSVPLTMCAWADSSVLATVAQVQIPQSRLARVALTFRDAVER